MPAKRKRSSSYRRRGKAPKTVRRRTRSYVRKPLALKPHSFCERLPPQYMTVVPSAFTSATTGVHLKWKFTDLIQSTHYADLFEYYTINKVVVTFKYKNEGGAALDLSAGGSGSQHINEVNPSVYFKVDHDSDSLDSFALMKESMRCHEKQLSNSSPNFTIQCKPAILVDTGNIKGALGTDYRPKWGQQITTKELDIEHYGVMAYAIGPDNISGTTYGQIMVDCKMYFTMKNNE